MAILSQKARQGMATKEAILDASMDLFAKNGFQSTSIDDLAREAGLTKGAIYWHFSDKEELFHSILGRISERWSGFVLSSVSPSDPPRAQVESVFDGYSRLLGKYPDTCLFMQRVLLEGDRRFTLEIGRLYSQAAKYVARIIDRGKSEGSFRPGVNSMVMGNLIIGTLRGAVQQRLVDNSLSVESLLEEAKASVIGRISV